MSKELQTLRDILCECPEVQKDLEELRFGCEIKDKSRDIGNNTFYIGLAVAGGTTIILSDEADDHSGYEFIGAINSRKMSNFEIIGNPITLRHLMMYCCSEHLPKPVLLNIDYFGILFTFDDIQGKEIARLDLTKELQDQNKEVLEKINKFLTLNK